ncbi:MAG: branched-chain amino acid ABC transporter permease [Chloroflexi bacterium]|nr:branched-chain amino acid ABC transporter permease [Chloroflexota bacterium]MDA8189855.1 branched-chain amino acid ABC transporter permease [Dehalococcoidales bacterium]
MQFWINVVVLASTYALLAAGYVLIYRASRVLNLAHGELMMLAAYLAFSIATVLPKQSLAVIPLTLLLAALIGVGIYYLFIRPMAGRPLFSAVLVTVAMGIVIQGLVVLVWTPRVQYLAVLLDIVNQSHQLAPGGAISTLDIASIVVALALFAALAAFFRYTRIGLLMRAAAENPLLLAQRGIDFHRLYAIAWGLAIGTAAVAGVLYTTTNRLEGTVALIGLKAFPVALVGGLGSLAGALPAALLVALAEVTAIQYVDPLLSNVAPFVVLLAALLLRPWGLFGTPEELERV